MLLDKVKNRLTIFRFRLDIALRELRKDTYVINSYAWMNYDKSIDHSNWGDDINHYFLKEIIDGDIVPYFHSFFAKRFNRPNYIVIGSTIDLIADKKSIIWGAGIIDSKTESLPEFREIRAVRGPLTRRKLLDMGFDCPEVYGDPALLIPLYYHPSIEKKYLLGIIPHFHDLEKVRDQISGFDDIKVIDIRNYKHWHDFVDDILSCKSIASSSLHGLIVAEAYNIPNVWIEFKNGLTRDHFKYNDFYASVGKYNEEPILLNTMNDLDTIFLKLSNWSPGQINLQPLIDAAPFKLKLKQD